MSRLLVICVVAGAIAGCAQEAATGPAISLATEVVREPWQSQQSAGEVITTRHYRIYTTSKRQVVLQDLPGFMEAAHDNYLALTGLDDRLGDKPMPIYMMGTRQEWALLTERISGSNRSILLSIEAGGYFHRGVCVFWDMGGAGSFSVAAHEGLHQFLNFRLKDRLPMWLEEGLCVSAEGHQMTNQEVRFTPDRNPFRFSALRNGITQGYFLDVAELLPMDAGDAVGRGTDRAVSYYGQLWALVMLIRSAPAYSEGFKRLLSDAEEGRFAEELGMTPEQMASLRRNGRTYNRTISGPLFAHYVSGDLKAFSRQYRSFARKLAGVE